jgi:citrate lyase subunit beta / citryl-CoA lyase
MFDYTVRRSSFPLAGPPARIGAANGRRRVGNALEKFVVTNRPDPTDNRSWLFVPGDSERKIERSLTAGADALIFDLEDSVTDPRRPMARELVAREMTEPRPTTSERWVRVTALQEGETLEDLVAVVHPAIVGIVLPKVTSASDVTTVDHYLCALEAARGIDIGTIRIAVVATETPQIMFGLGALPGCSDRFAACTWGAEDLSAALGATTNKAPDGTWDTPYQLAQAMCLLAAGAAGVQPVDTLHADFTDDDGLAAVTNAGRRQGFTGKLAIHPRQVGIINQCMTPSAAEIAEAEAVLTAFAEGGSSGTVSLDGRMLDRPHLVQAQRVITRARRASTAAEPAPSG